MRSHAPCSVRVAVNALHALGTATVHVLESAGPHQYIGYPWGIDQAIAHLNRASAVTWVDNPLGHDLAVTVPGQGRRYLDVRRPD